LLSLPEGGGHARTSSQGPSGSVRPPAATEGTGHLHFPADDTLRMAAPGWQPLTVKLAQAPGDP